MKTLVYCIIVIITTVKSNKNTSLLQTNLNYRRKKQQKH